MLITITIDYTHHARRLDHFLRTFYNGTPISHVQKLIRKGCIKINHKKVQASSRIYSGDILSLPQPTDIPDKQFTTKRNTLLEKSILFENEHFLIVDKPCFMPVHKGSGHETSLIDDLEALYQSRLYLVHRLDKLTGGVMVIAKHPAMQNTLSTMFKEKTIHKTYHCVVERWSHGEHIQVDAPLLRIRQDFMDISCVHSQGKPSTSIFTVIGQNTDYTLLEVKLITGRMHQIRAHCIHLDSPILGDALYNPRSTHNVPGMMLHAQCLSFHDNEPRIFYAQWPQDKYLWLVQQQLLSPEINR